METVGEILPALCALIHHQDTNVSFISMEDKFVYVWEFKCTVLLCLSIDFQIESIINWIA